MLVLLVTFFVGLFVFHTLERIAPIRTEYPKGFVRRGYWADLVHTIVNGPGLSSLTKVAFTWLVTLLPDGIDVMSRWSWAAQFIVFFLINDLARYWLHRWYHASDLLWRIHRVHHTIVEMDALSVFRIHLLEAVIKNGLIFLPLKLLGTADSVIITYSAIDILKGFWHHANLRTTIGPLNYIFNSAELHWWHHSTEARGQRANYGSALSIWDWLFGTAYWPRGQWPEQIGVAGLEAFPDDYVGQLTSVRYNDEQASAIYQHGRRAARDQPPDRNTESLSSEALPAAESGAAHA